MNEPLMDAVVQMVLFLELSDTEIVNEDAAIGMLEQIASTLQKLSPTDKRQLHRYLEGRSARAETDKERQTLKTFTSNLGLIPQ